MRRCVLLSLAAGATAAQAGPQAAARVSRPTTITPHTVKANESLGGEDSFVMIDRHEAVGVRAEEERRRETDEKKAAEGHSVDLALKDYVVVDHDYNEMKEKARKEHETKKSKMAAVEDIEQRTKEEMKRRFAEEEMKSGTKEGGVQHKNRIEVQKRKLKSDGEFFMTWLKVIPYLKQLIFKSMQIDTPICYCSTLHCVDSHTSCYHMI